MHSSSVCRALLLLVVPLLTLGANCDFKDFVIAFCAQNPEHPQCAFCAEHPRNVKCHEEPLGNIVFVTSTVQNGNLGGLAGADAICNGLASTAGLAGTYVAWLSTTTVDARDRLTEPGGAGFVRTDGAVVATSIADLLDNSLASPIQLDENGTDIGAESVWTGTYSGGVAASPLAIELCSDWTSGGSHAGGIGASDETDGTWSLTVPSICSLERHLYCFEVDAEE